MTSLTTFIRGHRRSLTVAGITIGTFLATTAPSWAFVYHG